MASWIDYVSFLVTVTLFGGAIYAAIVIARRIADGVQSTKEALKEKGLNISDKGVSIKTSKRLDRDDYMDATQRGFIKAMGAASFGGPGSPSTPLVAAPQVKRTESSSSQKSLNGGVDEKKRGLFRRSAK